MIVPHQSPSACQVELTVPSSSSTVVGDQRNLLMSVAIRSSWPLRWCLSERPIALELFPFQATCALKHEVFPRFWLRDDIARNAAQMVDQVGTGTPLVLVCLALLRSSAGRRRLNKKRDWKKKPLGMGRLAARVAQKTRVCASAFVSGGGLRRNRRGGGVFSSLAWPGRCKAEEGGGGRRLLSLPARGAQEEEDKKTTMLTPQQHAPRRDNPAPPRPPSRSHLRLLTALHLAAPPLRRRRSLLSSRSAGRRS